MVLIPSLLFLSTVTVTVSGQSQNPTEIKIGKKPVILSVQNKPVETDFEVEDDLELAGDWEWQVDVNSNSSETGANSIVKIEVALSCHRARGDNNKMVVASCSRPGRNRKREEMSLSRRRKTMRSKRG